MLKHEVQFDSGKDAFAQCRNQGEYLKLKVKAEYKVTVGFLEESVDE